LRLGQLHLLRSTLGWIDRSQNPPYRIFVTDATLDVRDLANRAGTPARPASARLTGLFMGSGRMSVNAVFRPQSASQDLGAELAIENASLPALNDLLRTTENLEVTAGTVSLYSQFTITNGDLEGYVKPLFRDAQVNERKPQPTISAQLKQKAAGLLAKVLKNRQTQEVATRTAISGQLGSSKTSVAEIIAELLRNAFIQPLRSGFENALQKSHHSG
jgi:hypothetical protein